MKTRAVVLIEHNKLDIMDLDIPELELGQVLVKMSYSGICGTQVGEFLGTRGIDNYLPRCLGHEGVGIVIAKHSSVTKVTIGDRVVVSWIVGKGIAAATPKYTGINAGYCNTLLDYTVVSENRIYKVDIVKLLPHHALLGCAIPTGVGTVLNILKPEPHSSVGVWGCGGVGLCSIIALSKFTTFPGNILAVDISNSKLRMARKLGAISTWYTSEEIIPEVEYSIVATGNASAISKCISLTTKCCVVVGHPSPDTPMVEVEAHRLIRGLKLLGSWGGNCDMDKEIPLYRSIVDMEFADLANVIYDLEDINTAMEDAVQGNSPRVVVKFS